MPRRSTLFQRVMFQIHRQLAPESSVEESAFLRDSSTGQAREVDVVIRSKVGGYETIVSIECRDHARSATVEWVEQMAKKHDLLPTSKLVLLSAKGFSSAARLKAKALNIETYSLAEAAAADWSELFPNGIEIWALRLRAVFVTFRQSDRSECEAPPGIVLYDADGTPKGLLREVVYSAMNRSGRFTEGAIEFARASGEGIIGVDLCLPEPRFVRDGRSQSHEIKTVRLYIEVVRTPEIHLATGRFRDAPVAYGQSQSPAGEFAISFTQNADGKRSGLVSVTDQKTDHVYTLCLKFPNRDSKLVFWTDHIGETTDPKRPN